MRLALFISPTLSLSLASGPCERLCDSDGPLVCSNGSWLRRDSSGNRCHAYFRLTAGGHCYHTTETRETCPDTLPHLTPAEAEDILRGRLVTEVPVGSGEARVTSDLPVQPRVRRRVIPSPIPDDVPEQADEVPAAITPAYPDTAAAPARRRQRCFPGGYTGAPATASSSREPEQTAQQPSSEAAGLAPRRRQRCFPGGIAFTAPPAPIAPAVAVFPAPPTGPIERQTAHIFPPAPHPGHHLVRQTGVSHLPVQFHPAAMVSAVDITRQTPQFVADRIGSSFLSRTDWSQFCVSIASLMSRLEVPTEFGQTDAEDFWTRSNGDAILASAVAGATCEGREQNECFALMLLISHMPLPSDQDEAVAFMTRQGISEFIEANAEALANRLLRSEGNLMSVYVPHHLYGEIEMRGMGLLYGFAVNWTQRFPQIIASRPGLSRLVFRHALYRQMCSDPVSYDQASLRVRREVALESSTEELLRVSVPALRKGVSEVRYVGESAFGIGLVNEWFALMDTTIQETVFRQRADSVVSQLDLAETTTLDNLRAVGRYFALCIIHGRPTGLNLPVGFFKLLAGQQVGLEDSRDIDQAFHNAIRHYVGDITQDEFDALTFGMEDEPLVGSGATEPITMANKDAQVVMAVENLIMNNNRPAFNALVEGFTSLIPRTILTNVDAADFKGFICGNREIDAVAFFNNIDFNNRSAFWTADRIEWIRQIITGFNQERLSKLLRFVTGFQVLPAGGFPALGRIAFNAFPVDQVRFPTAHTCFKSLDMPIYATFGETREILTNVVDLGNFAGMSEGGM